MAQIRIAHSSDVQQLLTVINTEAQRTNVLPVTEDYILEHLPGFFVAVNEKDEIVGSTALRIYTPALAEIRSVVVKSEYREHGIGETLVRKAMNLANSLELQRVFILTYIPDWFGKLGFKRIENHELPEKIWKDCVKCPKFDACDEIAMIYQFEKNEKKLLE